MADRTRLLNIGFGNVVLAERVVAVVTPSSAPMKRLREEARVVGKLVDATQGRRTRAIVITDSDHVILSAIQAETIAQRLQGSLDPYPKPALERVFPHAPDVALSGARGKLDGASDEQ